MKKAITLLVLFFISLKSLSAYSIADDTLENIKDDILLSIAQGDRTSYLETLNNLEDFAGLTDREKADLVLDLLAAPGVQTPPIILDFSNGLAAALNIPAVETGNVFTTLYADTITENTTGHGTTINSVTIKSGALNNLVISSGSFGGVSYVSETPITANSGLIVVPSGTGYLATTIPDGTIAGGNARGQNAIDLQINRGTAAQVASAQWSTIAGGSGNTASNTACTIGGGAGNTASGLHSTAGGGFSNTASGDRSVVAGGYTNRATGNYTAISGGYVNTAAATASFVGGGNTNQVLANSSESGIVCGDFNTISTAADSFIGGGYTNTITGSESFLGGGTSNTISGTLGVICGGQANSANGTWSSVVGGLGNSITQDYSVLGGGNSNTITGSYSCIVGGSSNSVATLNGFIGGGSGNTISSDSLISVIVGGGNNAIDTASQFATNGGGFSNEISNSIGGVIGGGGANFIVNSQYGTIPGGTGNAVRANYGFAAGQRANVNAGATGSFVLADAQASDCTCNAANTMLLRFQNGVGINTTTPSTALDVAGNVHATAFPTSSDARFKDNIQYLGDGILDKVMHLKPCTFEWNDRHPASHTFEKGQKQIGFIAQEVEEYFPELLTYWTVDHKSAAILKDPTLNPDDLEDEVITDYRALDYARMVSLLCRAIQELKRELDGTKIEFKEALVLLREEFITKNSGLRNQQ